MAKRKESADTAVKIDAKKLKQVAKGKTGGLRAKKDQENGEKTEKLQRKAKPKSRLSKPIVEDTTATNTSKYFQDKTPVKEEPADMTPESDIIPPFIRARKDTVKLVKKEEDDDEDSEEDEDWEEVEELAEPLGPMEPVEPALPSQPVEIEIETPDIIHKRQKREKRKAEFETYLRRMMNRFNKDVVEDTHKVHLMCLLANGMFRNRLCSTPDLLAISLSLLPTHFAMVAKERIDISYLSGLLKWFGATFTLNPELPCEERPDPQALLERRLGSVTARDHQEMTHLFLLVLRSLQLFCRLVLSLQPLSLKPPSPKSKAKNSGSPHRNSPSQKKPPKENPSEPKVSPGTKRPAGGKAERGGKKAKKKEAGETKKGVSVGQKPKNSKRRSIASKVSYKEESSEGEGPSDGEEFQLTNEEDSEDSEGGAKAIRAKKGKGGKSKGKSTAPQKRSSRGNKKVKSEEEDEDWEGNEEEGEAEEEQRMKRGKRKEGKGADEWLEVYLEKTGCWVCVDVLQGVGQPQLCSKQATHPMTYVVAVDGDGHLKDLGSKYDPTWMTSTRKRRVDEEWWEVTLEPFLGPESERDVQEDKELQAKLLDKPLPTSIAEFKNHPMYALKRHLLKYEALYPSTAAILGYCRGEPVYSRDCIHTLHSRDTWLKEARTVRLGEEPYKMVRGFSNRSRKVRMASEQKDKDDLPLFGEWQTEEYQPPVAVDGRVPRNDFGNVYLFKPCMLPVGCVHLRLPNLQRVAKKLDMDCASAVTGFDFHGGYSHAVTDGYIVCEEHEEILRAAWAEDQEIQRQKEKEKREKRAVTNWTLLVKSLLIRERLQRRYGKKGPTAGGGLDQLKSQDRVGEEGLSSEEEGEGGPNTASATLAQAWPQNRQEEQDSGTRGASKTTSNREKRGKQKHLFPFEKV
ncbi:DNA repair protein complementing XP-C cells [Coregonus clupeaformis]|uniref:DNA repair protein complementing XP-C cells n=1 Tax=Coregonus clupeaformis TaxID=59861 RepID=UPI001BE0B136|nr:DNA repair protein complementing XP-C cells [Coregonus clupeaformis]